jgi:hypothetical protein
MKLQLLINHFCIGLVAYFRHGGLMPSCKVPLAHIKTNQPTVSWVPTPDSYINIIGTKRDTIGQWVSDTVLLPAVPHGSFVESRRSNRARLDFSGAGRAATYVAAGIVNASIQIVRFDYSVAVWCLNAPISHALACKA